MSTKKITALFLIMAIFFSMSTVSAGLFDFLSGTDDNATEDEPLTAEDCLINGSCTITYTNLTKSDTYAWYSEDTGEFVSDAYYGPWSADVELNLDIEKMYRHDKDQYEELENYTLDEYIQDMERENTVNGPVAAVMDFTIHSETGEVNPIVVANTQCHIDNKTNVLTVKYNYTDDDFQTAAKNSDREDLRNATTCFCGVVWIIPTSYYEDGEVSDLNQITLKGYPDFEDIPVTVVEV